MIESIILGLFGLLIGSFLNVCIYRIPKGESINYPASHCMHCKHTLGVLDLIPVISYLSLGGKCRYCKAPVSKQYMLIELLNGMLYAFTIYHFGLTVKGVMVCAFISLMIVLTLIDWRTMLLPTKIIVVGVVIALVLRAVEAYALADLSILLEGLWGGIVGYGILAIIFYGAIKVLKKEGMGYGDVRYLGMIGCFTSWQIVILTLFVACVIGSIYGVIQMRIRQKSEPFPFGPFLSIAAFFCVFWGQALLEWYIGLFY